jgi:SAM-dependent methyltransferase
VARAPHNWLVNRIGEEAFFRLGRRHLRGRLIDIGCGLKPYEGRFGPQVTEHVGVEHEATPHGLSRADLLGTAYAIPAPDGSFDSAVCSAVLEHLEEPEQALRECLRILRPGSPAIYTIPFIWHIHEAPRDFYRYSNYGIDHLFRKAGFDSVDIRPLSGYWVTASQMFAYFVMRKRKGALHALRIRHALAFLAQAWGLMMHRWDRHSSAWTWMYIVVARKPLAAAGSSPLP